MNKRIIAALSLSLSLVGTHGGAMAQQKDVPVIVGNVNGTCMTSPSMTNPGANSGDWTITCGDINPGSGMTVIGPPSVATGPVSVDLAPGIDGEPAPVSDPAPVYEPAPVEEPAPETTVDAAATDTMVASETDLDADNYPDAQEVEVGLDPNNVDTDADGVADGDEGNIYGTDPFTWDSDGDGVSDGGELYDLRTDPLVWDDLSSGTGDQTVSQEIIVDPEQAFEQKSEAVTLGQKSSETLTATNGDAAALGTGNASSAPGTVTRGGVSGTSLLGPDGTYSVTEVSPPSVNVSENSGAPPPVLEPAPETVTEPAEVVETTKTGEPVVAESVEATSTSDTDLDADNYSDALELEVGLDANNVDSDADGVADGDEANIYATDPLTWDSDGDGLADGDELFERRTDPLVWDTDGNGISDGEEVAA